MKQKRPNKLFIKNKTKKKHLKPKHQIRIYKLKCLALKFKQFPLVCLSLFKSAKRLFVL